jgi:DNA modification methylase
LALTTTPPSENIAVPDSVRNTAFFSVGKNMVATNRKTRRALVSRLKIIDVDISKLKPLGQVTREHTAQVPRVVSCLEKFGVRLPILISPEGRIVDGEAVVLAARQLSLTRIPAVIASDLSEAELRTLRLALNKLPEYATWNEKALRIELSEIIQLDPSISLEDTGFEIAELDSVLDDAGLDQEDELPAIDEQTTVVTQVGDQWKLGNHIVRCDNALEPDSLQHLLGAEKAGMAFLDPPYNVKIAGHVTRSRSAKYHDFPMASGELSTSEFQSFLETSLSNAARVSRDGAIHFVCIDWRHVRELLLAGETVYNELKNVCVWAKTNGGMGSFYRSQHELIAVYKVGTAAHVNNIELGRHGRNRTNVWKYVGQSALSGTRKSKLSLHPTVKPVAMIADAIRDCSHRGDLILDCFGGAGTTLIAAEKTGRRARILELGPVYVDVTIERWQRLTGQVAYHVETGQPFSSIKEPVNCEKGM